MSSYSDMVPGESCFNLNFSNPGGSFGPPINLASPGAETADNSSSAASNTAAAIIASVVSGVGSGSGGSNSTSSRSNSSGNRFSGHSGPKFHQISGKPPLPNGKKTKGRVKIKMEFIDNKLRRYTTFSKRKTGIMKKAYELSTLTGTQVMLLVASETGHVYTFATKKLQPMITSDAGKQLIQTCLNSPDSSNSADGDSTDLNSTMETGFHTSELNTSTPTKSVGKSKNGKSVNDVLAKNGKGSPKDWQSGSQLPTMVPPSSAFGSMSGSGPGSVGSSGPIGTDEDEDESDDSSNELSPSAMQVGETDRNNSSQEEAMTNALKSAHRNAASVAAAAQMLFPAASLIPTTVTTSNAASAFGLIPGLTPGGTVMYQVPQGVVYAAPTAVSLADNPQAANLMFAGLRTSTGTTEGISAANSGHQFITIPMPLSLQQMVSAQQQASSDNSQETQDSGLESLDRND